jgi:hypothetical protein
MKHSSFNVNDPFLLDYHILQTSCIFGCEMSMLKILFPVNLPRKLKIYIMTFILGLEEQD